MYLSACQWISPLENRLIYHACSSSPHMFGQVLVEVFQCFRTTLGSVVLEVWYQVVESVTYLLRLKTD